MRHKIKVLAVNTAGLTTNGISAVIYDYYSAMDLEPFAIDVLSIGEYSVSLVKAFEELGILEHEVQDEQAIVKMQCDYQHPHHHHFICTNCHRAQELQMCPLGFFEDQVPGAKIASHNFELYGLCADCAKKLAK